MVTRRQFLARLGSGVAIVGFAPATGMWVSSAEAAAATPFDRLPRLDGTLHFDVDTRMADSVDLGRVAKRLPLAVLKPGSVADIQKMVRFCGQHGIKVSMRGQGHSTQGQGLTSGLLIESRSLATIHSVGPDGADVDCGVLWREVVTAALPLGLTVPLTTTYVGLSIGGTLSMGGFGARNDTGVQVDTVEKLHVVTGTGELVECSATRNRELFEVALAGMGQCGLIVRATVRTVPAYQRARIYEFTYTDNAQFFADLRLLVDRGELDGVYNLFKLTNGTIPYQLNAMAWYNDGEQPDDAHLLRGISQPLANATVVDCTYQQWCERYDPIIQRWRDTTDWDNLIKPWQDVIMPDSTVEQYVGEVMPTMTPEDFGSTGVGFVFRVRRSALTRPFFRIPEPDGGDWVYLFDILTSSEKPGPDPAFARRMLDRNRRLFDRARALGGVRYPIGSLEFDQQDWRRHYGALWPELVRRKRRYDPHNILTPGPGIF
jgi:FAD/FMN-containing dehydrogenase